MGTTAFAQTEVEFLNKLAENKLSEVEGSIADQVKLCIEDVNMNVSRAEAVKKINAFLNSKTIKSHKILHKGSSDDKTSSYRVARLKASDGMYRVFAYVESNKIKEIRIDAM